MKNKILSILLVLPLLITVTACSSPTASSTDPQPEGSAPTQSQSESSAETASNASESFKGDVKIGIECTITGPVPIEGENAQRGANMAAEEWNAKGGVQGYKVVIQAEDDAQDQTTAVNVAQKFASDKSILVQVGPIQSSSNLAQSETIKKGGLPFLAGGSSPKLYDLENPYLFRMRASDTLVAEAAVRFVVEDLKYSKIGLLYINADFGTGAKSVIEKSLGAMGMKLEVAEGHNVGDKDMTSGILKLKNAGVDCIICWSYSAESAIISRQINELGMKEVPFVGAGTFAALSYLDLVDDSEADGKYVVGDFAAANPNEFNAGFRERYNAKYGKDPDTISCYYYDGVMMACDALNRAEELTRDSVAEALRKIGVDSELILNGGKIYLKDIDLVHQVIIGQNTGKEYIMIKAITE